MGARYYIKHLGTCWDCEKLTLVQTADLTSLENRCAHFLCIGRRCQQWKERQNPSEEEMVRDDEQDEWNQNQDTYVTLDCYGEVTPRDL